MASWGLVADFCFGDLLLVVPVDDAPALKAEPTEFQVIGHIRPTTSQTLYQHDLVGRRVDASERPQFTDAWRSGEVTPGQSFVLGESTGARIDAVPVRRRVDGNLSTIAILSREVPVDAARRPGRLERVYLEIFDRLSAMIVDGQYPFVQTLDATGDIPRVGDGVLVLDHDHVISYASPNAVSAMHRLGQSVNLEGRRLRDLVNEAHSEAASRLRRPVVFEVAQLDSTREQRAIVLFHTIPLFDHDQSASGAVVLLRDVSDLRRRDQWSGLAGRRENCRGRRIPQPRLKHRPPARQRDV